MNSLLRKSNGGGRHEKLGGVVALLCGWYDDCAEVNCKLVKAMILWKESESESRKLWKGMDL